MKENDHVRSLFNEQFTYSDVDEGDILALIFIINSKLKEHRKKVPEMMLRLSKVSHVKKNTNGSIKECYLYCNGTYFKKREAISFNRDGFIGFAGWASSGNSEPFTEAFKHWIDQKSNYIEPKF